MSALAEAGSATALADALAGAGFLTAADVFPRAHADAAACGREVGPYLLLEPIWSQGQVEVHVALDRVLEREVALKLILAPGPEALERLHRSSRLWADLDAIDGIVPVYAAGRLERDVYIAMRFFPGGSLAARTYKPKTAAAIVARVARAAHAAHEQGVLHRDIKPANILLDDQGRPHLADFGLAKETDLHHDQVTVTGTALGTPGFMAPEQATGDRPADRRTDVYGLGATLFALLTGEAPIQGRNPYEALKALLEAPTPSLRSVDPTLPLALDTIVRCAMAQDPRDRYTDARALARDLERWVNGKAPAQRHRRRKRADRRPHSTFASNSRRSVPLAVALTAGTVALGWIGLQARTSPTPTRQPATVGSTSTPRSTAATAPALTAPSPTPDRVRLTPRARAAVLLAAGEGTRALPHARAAQDADLVQRARLQSSLQHLIAWQVGVPLLIDAALADHAAACARSLNALRADDRDLAPRTPESRRRRAAYQAVLGQILPITKGTAAAALPLAITTWVARAPQDREAHLLAATLSFLRGVRRRGANANRKLATTPPSIDPQAELKRAAHHAERAEPLWGAALIRGHALLERVRPGAFASLTDLRLNLDTAIGALSRSIAAATTGPQDPRRPYAHILRGRALALRLVAEREVLTAGRRTGDLRHTFPATGIDDLKQAERDHCAAFLAEPRLKGLGRWARLIGSLGTEQTVLVQVQAAAPPLARRLEAALAVALRRRR